MGSFIVEEATIEVIHCAACGCLFGVPDDLIRRFRKNGQTFYCPSGHHNYYLGETDKQKIKRLSSRLASAQEQSNHYREQRDATQRSNVALRGVTTRIKRRIAKGVCPCCNRTFADLARHMESKHPKYDNTQ